MRDYEKELEDLKMGTIEIIHVDKNEFYEIREILTKREDFKHFRGIAHQGGKISYVYNDVARS